MKILFGVRKTREEELGKIQVEDNMNVEYSFRNCNREEGADIQ